MSEPEKTEGTESAEPEAQTEPAAEPESDASASPPQPEAQAEKRTSLDLKGAGIPVLITLLLAVFIVYPYVKDLREHGAQSITDARKQRAEDSAQVVVTEEATALLDGLKVGDKVQDFQVVAVRGPRLKRIEIELGRAGQTLRVFVSRIDSIKLIPPRKTQMYAVYYENAKPNGDAVSSEEYLALVEAIAKRVEKQERQVSMPDNL